MKRLGVSLLFFFLFLVGFRFEPYVIQLGDPITLAMFLFTPVLTIFTGVMSFRYGRTGVSFFLILIALLYGIYLMPGGSIREQGFLELLRLSLLLIVPILVFYFALSPDKGFNSISGRVGIILLASGIISAWMFITIPELGATVTRGIEQISQFPLLMRFEQMVNRDVPGALVLLWIVSFVILLLASIFGRRGGFWLAPWPYILFTFGAGISRLMETTVLLYWLNLGIIFVLLILINEGWTFAFLDPLTNIPNRRYLEMYLQRLGGEGMVAMADIDHFKRFNDTYGHETGDQVLKMTARVLSQQAKGFRVFRYGGEEFTLIGKTLEPALAKQTLEETRKALELRQFFVRKKKKPVTVTVSIGLVEYDKQQPAKVALEYADKALYKAKKNGRNQVFAPLRKKISHKP